MTQAQVQAGRSAPSAATSSTQSAAVVAVIGAGIIGICSALELQRRGFKVIVLDPNGIASGASCGNAGHFATEQVFPLADPVLLPELPKILLDPQGPFRVRPAYFMRALPWFLRFLNNMRPSRSRRNGQLIKQLNERAIAAYQALLASCNLADHLHLSGSLLTFEKTDLKLIKKQQAELQRQGVAVQLLDRAAALALEPALAETVTHCLYFTDVGHTADPGRLCRDLAEHFITAGGEFNAQRVMTLTEQDKGVQLALKADGDQAQTMLQVDQVVVCCGAWSKPFAQQLGYKVPLDTERGYHLMVPAAGLLQRPVASAERKFIMTPMQGGLRLAGTVEFAGLDAPADYRRADMLLPHAQDLLNAKALADYRASEDTVRWMGCRPSLPDSVPVMGRAPHHQRVYFNFGHQHLGLTWGAIAGRLIAQQIGGESPDIDLTPYSIARFNG